MRGMSKHKKPSHCRHICVWNGRIVREGIKHEEHTPMGAFFVTRVMAGVRDPLNTKNTPMGMRLSCSRGWGRGGGSGGIKYKERAPIGLFFMTRVTAGVRDP